MTTAPRTPHNAPLTPDQQAKHRAELLAALRGRPEGATP